MLKIVMSKIEYSNFSKLIKLSDSIKSYPHSFCIHHGSIGDLVGFPYAHPTIIPLNKKTVTKFGR